MAKKKIIKSEKIEPKYPISFETFRDIGNWEISNLTSKEPSSFNGWVRIKKYKITIDVVEESKEVYRERLQKLWDECDNSHQWFPLKSMAKELGIELIGDVGSKKTSNQRY